MRYSMPIAGLMALSLSAPALAQQDATLVPYPNSASITPPRMLIRDYDDIPPMSEGIDLDPETGLGLIDLGAGAWFVTEGVYQVMMVVHDDGVILADAPPTIGDGLLTAAEQIAPGQSITHLILSHGHFDHAGHAGAIVAAFPDVEIVAHALTAEMIERRGMDLPQPTQTFAGEDPFEVSVGGQTLQLTYPGPNHQDGNIEIWHAESRTLMLIDVIFPGWMMWQRLALAEDIPGLFDVVFGLNDRYDYTTLIAGHVGRPATPADVEEQMAFFTDLHAAAGAALGSFTPGEGMAPEDLANPWAVFDHYIDRVVHDCVDRLTPTWQDRLAAFEVFIHSQCAAMEQSIRVDGPSL